MKFLVTGSAGFVGRQLVKDLSESSQVYSCYHKIRPDFGIPTQMDITQGDNIEKTIQSVKPDVIIHCAAMTDVNLCEKQQDLAYQINVKATEAIARQAAKIKSFLVYVSTDYVFDGKNGNKKESDTPNPINHYGKTKLEGEIAVHDLASNRCIARTSTPFGIHPKKKSFPSFIAENLQAKKEIPVITDQYTSPTYVPNLSRMLIEVSARKLQGIIHLAGATRISRYEMAIMVAEKLGLDKSLIKQAKMIDMNWKAKRPRDSSLDVSKAATLLKEKPITVQQGLDLFIEQMRQKPN